MGEEETDMGGEGGPNKGKGGGYPSQQGGYTNPHPYDDPQEHPRNPGQYPSPPTSG